MALIDNIKAALRVDGVDFDDEVAMLIAAAEGYLIGSGVDSDVVTSLSDDRVEQLITIYCKALFGYDEKDTPFTFPRPFQLILEQLRVSSQNA